MPNADGELTPVSDEEEIHDDDVIRDDFVAADSESEGEDLMGGAGFIAGQEDLEDLDGLDSYEMDGLASDDEYASCPPPSFGL